MGIRRTAIRAAIAALLGQTATAGPLQVYAGGNSGGTHIVLPGGDSDDTDSADVDGFDSTDAGVDGTDVDFGDD